MGVQIADSILAFARRLLGGRPVFHADTGHIHHRLLRLGLSPRGAVFTLWYLCAYLGAMAIVLEHLPRGYALLLVGVQGAGLLVAFELLERIDRKLGGSGAGREPDPE
jgi:UDP-GlcNAc:undecaprenyl-phosphate GlcNAc-1-phosphate transferase